jgi:hypothetical protein
MIETEIAPGPRQQNVLDRLATDVLGILFARQHPIRIEADDADPSCAHERTWG